MGYWQDEFTDETAASYMATYGEGPGCETRLLLASLINNGESVLDVGCGPGWNYDHFIEFGPEVEYKGLDSTERFVRVANQRMIDRGFAWAGEAIFQIGDVRDIPELNKSWDVVILQDVLEHTNGYEKPLTEALRVARKRIIATFWHLDDSDTPHINDDGDDTWGAWYDKREWEKFLDTLDFHWLHVQLEQGNRVRDFYVIDKEVKHG